MHRPLILAFCAFTTSPLAQDWGALATISSTMGVQDGRLCLGEASRGDIGCPASAPYVNLTNGNVGIQTASPNAALHVSGTATLQGPVTVNSYMRLGFYRYQSPTMGLGSYLHLKTNQPLNNIMQTVEFKGYEYHAIKTLSAQISYYPYLPDNNVTYINASGTHPLGVYKSADGYVVLTLNVTSSYYLGFILNQYGPGPQGLFPLAISATAWSNSATGAF